MYTLLSGAYRHYFQKDEYCILILGLDDAGKTTFLEQTKTKFNQGTFHRQTKVGRIVGCLGGSLSQPSASIFASANHMRDHPLGTPSPPLYFAHTG